jgi:hypothetical protein
MRLSVFRTSEFPEAEIWGIADRIVVQGRFHPKVGADLISDGIRTARLEIEPEPTPHPRHADIVGWSEEKSERIQAAKSLAAKSTLVLRAML